MKSFKGLQGFKKQNNGKAGLLTGQANGKNMYN